MELADAMGERVSTQPAVERLIAVGYGLTYDAIVRGFAPYQALLDEIAALVASGGAPGPPVATRVLDVSCGIGTVAERLARRGWSVVGLDSVGHLVSVARRTHRDSGLSLSFQHVDVARDPLPDNEQKQAALSYLNEAWAEARHDGVDGDCLAQASLFAAFAELVGTYGEDAVAKFVEGLPTRVRNGEFSIALAKQ